MVHTLSEIRCLSSDGTGSPWWPPIGVAMAKVAIPKKLNINRYFIFLEGVVTPGNVEIELIAKGAIVGLFYAKFFPRPRKCRG